MKKIIYGIFLILILGVGFAEIPETTPILKVSTESLNTNLKLANQNPDPASPGGCVEIRFKVENLGRSDVENLKFKLIPEYPFSLLPTDSGERILGKVDAGQVGEDSYILYYKLRVDSNAISDNYNVRLKYTTDGINWIDLNKFQIRVKSENTLVTISHYKTPVADLGSGFVLNFTIENYGDTYIKNLVATIDTAGLPFKIIDGANSKIFKIINGNSGKALAFQLSADADAVVKTYEVPITLTYLDDENTKYTQTYKLSIKLNAHPDLVAMFDEEQPTIIDKTNKLSIKFVNKGFTEIKNLYITVQDSDDFKLISPSRMYVGSIDADDYETSSLNIKCSSCTPQIKLQLTLDYYDINNKHHIDDITLVRNAYSRQEAIEQGFIKEKNYAVWAILAAALVVLIVLFKVFKRKD